MQRGREAEGERAGLEGESARLERARLERARQQQEMRGGGSRVWPRRLLSMSTWQKGSEEPLASLLIRFRPSRIEMLILRVLAISLKIDFT